MQPTRNNYQSLRVENARAPQEPAPQVEKQEAPGPAAETQAEPQPHRPDQVHPSTGRVTDSGGMEAQHELINDLMKQHRAEGARQAAQPAATRQGADTPAEARPSGKDVLDGDLAEAKQGRADGNQERETGQGKPAAAASREGAGKDTTAADLKEAKESTQAHEPARDSGRSR